MRQSFDDIFNEKVDVFGRPVLRIVLLSLLLGYFLFLIFILPLIFNTYFLVPGFAILFPFLIPDFLHNSRILHRRSVTLAIMYLGVFFCTSIYIYLAIDTDTIWKYIHYPAYGLFAYLYGTKY